MTKWYINQSRCFLGLSPLCITGPTFRFCPYLLLALTFPIFHKVPEFSRAGRITRKTAA